MEIVKSIYQMTKSFPREEQYCLVTQMRRAAISVPSNIAEGYSRKNRKEFRQFLFIALGSLGELETQLEIAKEFLSIDEVRINGLFNQIDHERSMILKLSHSRFAVTQPAAQGVLS